MPSLKKLEEAALNYARVHAELRLIRYENLYCYMCPDSKVDILFNDTSGMFGVCNRCFGELSGGRIVKLPVLWRRNV